MATRNPIPIGEKFNYLTILSRAGSATNGSDKCRAVLARCDCGVEKVFRLKDVISGNSKSCGCLAKKAGEKTYIHGHATDHAGESPTYRTWGAMVGRCTNPNHSKWYMYGAKGITVCDRWRTSFVNFLADMGERPDGKTLDRFPNGKGNYEPGNCRWATLIEQANNTSRNLFLEFEGLRMTVPQWAARLGINQKTLRDRLQKGWSTERALTQKLGPRACRPK